MEKLIKLATTAVPLPTENIDTDQIIPARFLKASTKKALEIIFSEIGDIMFITNEPNPDFVLNNPKYSGEILVAGNNFGCGSSRDTQLGL